MFGGRAFFKFENLQRTGSFKERGALNRILTMSEQERARGVIAASAGNHAQGVAYHAGRLGVRATVVMPERTPLVKVSSTEGFGARVILHGSTYDEAMEQALRLEEEHGYTLIPPFDDEHVIAGQGTIGLELLEQCPGMEVLVVPVGGGGLIAGIAIAVKASRPEVRVIGVEAERVPAALRARQAGRVVTIPAGETIADGIAVRRVGDLTFPLIEEWVDDLVTVREEEIASAVLLLLERE
jgi:threonine dehydratase